MEWLYASDDPLLETAVLSILVFIFIVIVTRIIGLRSFAKFTTFDFAFTVAVGSAVAAILTSSTSFAQGAIAIFCLLLLTAIFAWLQQKSDLVDKLMSNKPLLLMDGETILEDNLHAARVSRDQLIAKLREANVSRFSQVLAVVLETTGDISVIHTTDDIELEDRLLTNVRRKP